jgi:hypothetical protein
VNGGNNGDGGGDVTPDHKSMDRQKTEREGFEPSIQA